MLYKPCFENQVIVTVRQPTDGKAQDKGDEPEDLPQEQMLM